MAQHLTFRGQVADESGALVPAASIVLNGPSALVRTAKSASDGSYVVSDLAPGDYTVRATAPQLVLREPISVSLRADSQTLNLVRTSLSKNSR